MFPIVNFNFEFKKGTWKIEQLLQKYENKESI